MNKKNAVLFGATGLIGSALLHFLLKSEEYGSVKIFVRKSIGTSHIKLTEKIIDFDVPETWKEEVKGDVVFCCLGTTMEKAGSKSAFIKVDLEYPALIAKTARENAVPCFLVISSIGADKDSRSFYLRVKGQMEEEVKENKITHTYILRPALLLGDRKETRIGESIGKYINLAVAPVLFGKFKKYKPIHVQLIAKAILKIVYQLPNKITFESDEIAQVGN